MSSPEADDDFSAVCPYLGLSDDADSHATYPTDAHRCYRLETPTRIASGHQQTYCLGANHISCPVFRGEGIAAASAPAAAAAAAPSGPAHRPAPAGRPQPGAQPARPSGGRTNPFEGSRRAPSPGALGPRPRAGGISMPVATIGLFAAAVIILAAAFAIVRLAGDGGDDQLPVVNANASLSPAASTTPRTGTPGTQNAGATTTGTPGTPGTGTPASTPDPGGTYVVKSGDFCGSIASANNVSLEDLLKANNMTEADCTSLQVGQELKLP